MLFGSGALKGDELLSGYIDGREGRSRSSEIYPSHNSCIGQNVSHLNEAVTVNFQSTTPQEGPLTWLIACQTPKRPAPWLFEPKSCLPFVALDVLPVAFASHRVRALHYSPSGGYLAGQPFPPNLLQTFLRQLPVNSCGSRKPRKAHRMKSEHVGPKMAVKIRQIFNKNVHALISGSGA